MSYATIDDLRARLGSSRSPASERQYAEKMLHHVPDAPVVNRVEFVLDHCRGKRVLEFGASGPLHDQIMAVASTYLGVDRAVSTGVMAFDLDDVTQSLVPEADPEIIVCGEVLEHLSNPGWFLTRLRRQYPEVPVLITVPNAFTAAGRQHITRGVENTNIDHVAWYSFRTLKTLVGRAGYVDLWFGWYNGSPLTAEGLIVVVQ